MNTVISKHIETEQQVNNTSSFNYIFTNKNNNSLKSTNIFKRTIYETNNVIVIECQGRKPCPVGFHS